MPPGPDFSGKRPYDAAMVLIGRRVVLDQIAHSHCYIVIEPGPTGLERGDLVDDSALVQYKHRGFDVTVWAQMMWSSPEVLGYDDGVTTIMDKKPTE